MKLLKVAAAAVNQTPLDWPGNAARLSAAIDAARQAEVALLCLPELCITGYGCEDAFFSTGMQQTALDVLNELVPKTTGMVVSFGLPVLYGGGLFNMCALAADGKLLGLVGKKNLAGDGVHYEPRWFKPWPAGAQAMLEIAGQTVPIGDLVFSVGDVRIGFEICEDAWVANRPGAMLAEQGVDIILNPSASHFAFGKQEVRERFVLEGSRAFGVGYVYANLLGNESGRIIFDGETMIASCGKMLALGERFRFEDFRLTTAVLDIDASRMTRARTGSFRLMLEPDDESQVASPCRAAGAVRLFA
jgi:NAD+ synthase (glutamine-hydrolysing)